MAFLLYTSKMIEYRNLKIYWRLILKTSTKLDLKTFHYKTPVKCQKNIYLELKTPSSIPIKIDLLNGQSINKVSNVSPIAIVIFRILITLV